MELWCPSGPWTWLWQHAALGFVGHRGQISIEPQLGLATYCLAEAVQVWCEHIVLLVPFVHLGRGALCTQISLPVCHMCMDFLLEVVPKGKSAQ